MKAGTFAVLLKDLPLEQALDHIKSVGVEAVESSAFFSPTDWSDR
jgi:sugar phosphate isomerase/epimerase